MTEDNLLPNGDEAGRVPGAMNYQTPVESDPFYLRTKTPPGAMSPGQTVYFGDEIMRKHERNRLVWEAMKVYMVSDWDVLHRSVRIVDEYLAWRDEQ